jgi:hypothetical protein
MIKELWTKFKNSEAMLNLSVYLMKPGNLLKTVKRIGICIFIIVFFIFIFNMLGNLGF